MTGDGGVLPGADGGMCRVDTDCPADACMDVRCVGGLCLAAAPMIDRDGDGHAPPMCGGDCDDGDPSRFPGASETCDGRDNDCDGMIDDGAPPLDQLYNLSIGDQLSVVAPWPGGFLVTQASTGAIFGATFGLDGSVGPPVELMRLSMGSMFTGLEIAAHPDGRVLLVAHTDFGAAQRVVLSPGATGGIQIAEPASGIATSGIQRARAIAFGTGFAVALDEDTAMGLRRRVYVDPATTPIVDVAVVPTTSTVPGELDREPFGLATDGTNLVVAHDDHVLFFDAAGAMLADHLLTGTIVHRPLASQSGAVVAAWTDAFGVNLARIDVAAIGMAHPAPTGEATDIVGIAPAGGSIAITRIDRLGARGWLMDADLTRFVRSSIALDGGRGRPARVTVAQSGDATAMLAGFFAMGASVQVLSACGAAP